jgi:DNA mismatch repair ATPase MutS
MKAYLMFRDRDFYLRADKPWNTDNLKQDLELDTLVSAMAQGDDFLFDVSMTALLTGLTEPSEILYRQDVLHDCIANEMIVRSLYDICVEVLEKQRKNSFGLCSSYPGSILHAAVDLMNIFVDMLKRLRAEADLHLAGFSSKGFLTLFTMLQRELSNDYFSDVKRYLKELRFGNGITMSATLGAGNKGQNYVLRLTDPAPPWWQWQEHLARRRSEFSFRIPERDEAGARALNDLESTGINLVANALAQSVEHIGSFFTMLRTELAFYVGCLNLRIRLLERRQPVCLPRPLDIVARDHSFKGLYEVCLALSLNTHVVGNEEALVGQELVVVTGANQGGKSTYLKSIGLAQLMMQAGMFVGAEDFHANVVGQIMTHYKREEDSSMRSGKFDEELARMAEIVSHARSGDLILFNESFAATNEREGSEIARQIIKALHERRIKVVFVTHLYDFAHSVYQANWERTTFLRAERKPDGERTFHLIEGEPLETSFGEDLYATALAGSQGRNTACT